MRYANNIILIIFILFLLTAFSFNIIIVMISKNATEIKLNDINAVYLDFSSNTESDEIINLKKFLKTNNSNVFIKELKNNGKPVNQFYSFCGLLKYDQKKAKNYLKPIIVSQKIVTVIKNDSKSELNVGYLTLLLLSGTLNELSTKPSADFFIDIQDILEYAYSSEIAKKDSNYKKELLTIISKNNAELTKKIFGKIALEKDVEDMTIQERISVSYVLSTMEKEDKTKIAKELLNEDNETIITNVINSIDEEDKSIARSLSNAFNTDYSEELLKIAIEKYGDVLQKESLPKIRTFASQLRNNKQYSIVILCLNQIKKYGNSANYDELKKYLETRYPEELNVAALDAIVETSYDGRTEDVLNTLRYVLRKIEKEELSYFAVKFHIDKNLKERNVPSILYRLKNSDSKKMKELALDYIEKFNKTGSEWIDLLEDLSADSDSEINSRANELISKMDVN